MAAASSLCVSMSSWRVLCDGHSLSLLLLRRRRCPNPSCKRLKKAMEFDLQIQNEECVKGGGDAVREVDALPWKSGCREDYECLTEELKKMAPVNGRAVLLFRAKCGCPLAKLEGWGPKRTRKHKKGLALGGGYHR